MYVHTYYMCRKFCWLFKAIMVSNGEKSIKNEFAVIEIDR